MALLILNPTLLLTIKINKISMNKITIFTILLTSLFFANCITSKVLEREIANPTKDNSQTSLDWEGLYEGVLPCADCSGIETSLELNSDNTYNLKRRYLGNQPTKSITSSGTFSWNADGGKISLEKVRGNTTDYLVGENQLIQLDSQGERITGNLADKYRLEKKQFSLENTYWQLTELNGQTITKDMLSRESYMMLKSESNRVAGNSSCNTFSGIYNLEEGNQLAFSQIIATRMACPNMEYESRFLNVMEKTDNYAINGNQLMLHKARTSPIAKFKAVELTNFWVNSQQIDCVGVGPMKCLQIQKGETYQPDTWELFYANIKGFNYEEGYIYKLLVKEEQLAAQNVPADGSSISYVLVEMVEKKPAE